MKLFINLGVLDNERNGNVEIFKLDNDKTVLRMANYLEKERQYEFITFFLPCEPRELKKELRMKQVYLFKEDENTYHFKEENVENNNGIYALLRSTRVVPDDVFIPTAMKDRVKVIRRIRFGDYEVDYGGFLSNVYLIKVKLQVDETLPVYLTDTNPHAITEQYVFSRNKHGYGITEKLETLIYVNKKNKKDFVSLSKL